MSQTTTPTETGRGLLARADRLKDRGCYAEAIKLYEIKLLVASEPLEQYWTLNGLAFCLYRTRQRKRSRKLGAQALLLSLCSTFPRNSSMYSTPRLEGDSRPCPPIQP
jgi:tetratricopeptide (TPR) repeat protein